MTVTAFSPPDTPPKWIRPRRFRVEHIELAVRMDLERARAEGEVEHRCVWFAGAERRTAIFDQVGLTISAVTIDGVAATYSQAGDELAVAMPSQVGERFAVRISFAAEQPVKGLTFVPADAARGQQAMAWTQGAMEDHRYWFPAFDDPNNLATCRIAITHRTGLTGIANGDHVGERDHGDGWTTSAYAMVKPMVLYLINVAVGAFVAVDGEPAELDGRLVPICHWLPRGEEAKALAMFRATAFAIRWLSELTGTPYAWPRYGHVVVHRFPWGGMENTTLTTITDRVLMDEAVQRIEDVDCDSLVIHELVHQWFGDLLTMKTWSDIWLNESFATWLECRGLAAWRAQRGEDGAAVLDLLLWENRHAYLDEDGGRYRRPLVTNRYRDAYELFDRVAYEKGSLVLNHLAHVLGGNRLDAAVRHYVAAHVHDLVESDDLRQAIEDATGEPLDWFFAQWLRRGGHPKISVKVTHDAGRGQLSVDIAQETAGEPGEPWRLPTAIAWCAGGVIERRTIELTRANETFCLPCASAPEWICVDPDSHLPAEWDESGDVNHLRARASDRRLGAAARARACVALGKVHPSPSTVTCLGALAVDPDASELVQREALTALGSLRGEAAVQALLDAWPKLVRPRLRRVAAAALGEFRRHDGALALSALADRLLALADGEPSRWTAGELLAARGAIEQPGAAPALRARLGQPSWNDRLAIGAIRGLGASGEPAAIDDLVPLLADRTASDALRQSAAAAVARLGARHLAARPRIRRALESLLNAPAMHLRGAAAKALGELGDADARSALATQLDREVFGNVARVIREALVVLGKTAATTTVIAEVQKRCDDLEREAKDLKRRLEAMEKRLG